MNKENKSSFEYIISTAAAGPSPSHRKERVVAAMQW